MNILITSAGRRGYMVEYFKEALNVCGKVYVGNSSPFASSFCYGDEMVITPLIYEDNYIPFLLDFCLKKEISVIVPLFDVDVYMLARNRKCFEQVGIRLIVSDEAVVRKCNDKWETCCFAKKNNILFPKTYLKPEYVKNALEKGEISFPVIIKPRWGMGSIGIYQADNMEELSVLYEICKRNVKSTYLKYEAAEDWDNCVLFQEKLFGEEYGVDIIHDLDGNFCTSVAKKKFAMRAGETDCAAVVNNPDIDKFSRKLGIALGHIANLDVDIYVNREEIYLLEMNARFGGGYPFSHLAGINLPMAIIKWIDGNPIENELKIKKYGRVIQKNIGFVDITEFAG